MDRERIAAKAAFARFRHGWSAMQRNRRSYAPRHNLIRFLGYERNEVALHSPFLCDLLDPNGTHDQGTLFLASFLEILSDRARASAAEWNYQWHDEPEATSWLVLPERGKIDISIRNRNQGVLIFIENKIDAPEQEDQLTRYFERLSRERTSYAHRLLVFLSPKSYGPPRTGKSGEYLWLNYEDDIGPWGIIPLT